MDEEALYWALSTLAQVNAALIAFVGFLSLQSIVEVSDRCKSLEEQTRDYLIRSHHYLKDGALKNMPQPIYHAIDGVRLMLMAVEELGNADPSQSATVAKVRSYSDVWIKLYPGRGRFSRVLAVFIGWNLFMLVSCLLLLAFGPQTSEISGVKVAWIVACLTVLGTTLVMVYEALFRPRP